MHPGVIILDFIPETNESYPRSNTGAVFAKITDYLAIAEANLVEESSTTFISKDFVKALRARIALYRGNYSVADGLAAERTG